MSVNGVTDGCSRSRAIIQSNQGRYPMNQAFIIDTQAVENLYYFANELCRRLAEARERLSDEEFEQAYEGPFDEIICAAMDVEDAWENCNKT